LDSGYIFRTYFPKHKVEKNNSCRGHSNKTRTVTTFYFITKSLNLKFVQQLEKTKNFKPNTEHGYSSSYKTTI
jgi:hypothetical protein